MLRCQYCGHVIHGQAAGLAEHIRQQHPEHAGVADDPEQARQKKEKYSPWKLGGLSVRELAKRVWRGSMDDDVFGRAAELGYYGFFSLFPALILLTAVLGMMAGPGTRLHGMLLHYMNTALPDAASKMIRGVLDQASAASGEGKITFGLLVSLWTASSAMAAVQDTLNGVYDVIDERPLWRARAIALGLTIVCSVLIVFALAVILYGGVLADFIGNNIGLSSALTWIWKIGQWPIALFFLSLVFALVYYYAPDVEQRHWEWITPGSVVGMATWLLVTIGFRVYVQHFNSYSATYGSLGAVIILLTWFYVAGLTLLLGGEVNAEIEHAAARRGVPDAKLKGQKQSLADRQQPAA